MDAKAKVLDIAMNLNRIGNWAADDFEGKKKRIDRFLDQTSEYIYSVSSLTLPSPFKKTFEHFLNTYSKLQKEAKIGPKDSLYWAEQMMTWGNILTHRASLIKE